MDKAKILRLCNEIENALSEAWNSDVIEYGLAGSIVSLARKIAAEITEPPKSNEEHTAAYWMQKTMDAAHEAYDRLKNTVDFKNAIAEVEAIKQRMGITEQKKLTNADRIRNMTDEELAEWLNGICNRCISESGCTGCPIYDCCAADMDWQEKWLKQEVSEDAGKTD